MRTERPATIALPGLEGDRGLALDGLFVAGETADSGGAVIAPSHPLYGGRMDSPVVSELAFACERAGLASLRFDWRGVGGSGGEPSGDVADAAADYQAAVEFLEDGLGGPLVACGYSFGAGAAAAVAPARRPVRKLMLVAPPPPMLDLAALSEFSGDVWIAAGERDRVSSARELEKIAGALERAEFALIEGTDHFFTTGLRELGRSAQAWLGRSRRALPAT